ncbi:hypothetical protein V5O48_015923 [Marasmius crinis-equi]|uniref:DNA 3'-5' helicase n=1 Tax=Marasmius crinis-equi TaxID=585013 RepID=A0ABR3ETG1_9AGAR
MLSSSKWTDSISLEAIKTVVASRIPQWPQGLFDYQLETISRILDKESVILFAGTGGGKAALFTVPLVIHQEVHLHPELYPNLPTRKNPMAIVVTPTKGLSNSIVHEAESFGLKALSYCHQTITHYRKEKMNLVDHITEFMDWNLICVDPEHLNTREWQTIIKHPAFAQELILFAVDEAHLVKKWGVDFRPAFELIGFFAQGHLPPHVPMVALSATCAPGPDMAAVCHSLGLVHDHYHLVRRSNERSNMHVIVELTKRVPGLSKYAQLLDYLHAGRKTVIHVNTIPAAYEIYEYLWEHIPEGKSPLRRMRMFHSLCSDEYNRQTFRLMDDDPELQVLIATMAFTMGINCRLILDSISWNFPSSLDDFWQTKGRAGRSALVVCWGIVLVPPSITKASKEFVAALDNGKSATLARTAKKGKKTAQIPMEEGKARFLLEERCYVAFLNRWYQNPDSSTLDCQEAGRVNFCSLCTDRYKKIYAFSPPSSPILWKPSIPSKAKKPSERKSKTMLGKREKKHQRQWLVDFRAVVQSEFQPGDRYLCNYPAAWFFPDDIIDDILRSFLTIQSHGEFVELLQRHSWRYTEEKSEELYSLLSDFQLSVRQQRKEEKDERVRKRAAKEASKESDLDSLPDNILPQPESTPPPPETPPLPACSTESLELPPAAPTTRRADGSANPKPRKPWEAQKSMAEYSASFGPQRTKRRR